MSLVVNTNVGALEAYRNLSRNQSMQQDAMSKLSSGLRINKAADDAAGLSISQGLTSQINGMTVAVRNAQDGINVAQIADGALATSQQILQRMRDLTVQAANSGSNGTDTTSNQSDALKAIRSELTNLADSLDKVSQGTKFNGNNLLDGSYAGQFQIGANADAGADKSNTAELDIYSTGAVASTAGTPSSSGVPSTSASSGVPSSAGTPSTAAVAAKGFGASDLGVDGTAISGVSGHDGAQSFLTAIDAAIKSVSNARATIGAFQNSLNYTISNLQSTIENVSASRSNITDADLATEVTQMTQAQILSQAATSVLAQANSAPQSVLKLLQ